MFPVLCAEEIARVNRFGPVREYSHDERLFELGKRKPGMFIVLSGAVRVVSQGAFGREAPIVEQGVGELLAELGQLSGKPALVDTYSVGRVEALLVGPLAWQTSSKSDSRKKRASRSPKFIGVTVSISRLPV